MNVKIIPMAYKIEMVDGVITERELTPEEYERDSKYAQEVLNSFTPKVVKDD